MQIKNKYNLSFFSRVVVFFACWLMTNSMLAQEIGQERFRGIARVSDSSDGALQLRNETTQVTLSPVGGRVLKYERRGKNVLFLSKDDNTIPPGRKSKVMSAGRFDVGPEQKLIRSEAIFSGRYSQKAIGDRKFQLTSVIDPESKMQVQRTFELATDSSELRITQKVTNHGEQPFYQHYWSRTFAVHGGICVIPIDRQRSLLPNYFLIAKNRFLVDFKPNDDAVEQRGDFLVVTKPPAFPKLGFDSVRGWVAYQTRQGQLFVKKFPVFPDRKYGDPGQMNFAIWYPKSSFLPACEIEPIGPLVYLQPGESTQYTVKWYLLDREFPAKGIVDPLAIQKTVKERCK